MESFKKIVQYLINWGTIPGGLFLIGSMLIVLTIVISRFVKIAFVGGHELMVLLVSVVIAFALPYTGLRKGHVEIDIITSRFSEKTRRIVRIGISFLTMAIWGLMSYAIASSVYERGLEEITETLHIWYAPFQIIFALGLIFLALSYVLEFLENIKGDKI
jgi:TRAP-type C4-dicarboxylate transport system permease small subunit